MCVCVWWPVSVLPGCNRAGATSGALTTPLDVLKTRLMTCTVDCAGGSVRTTFYSVFYTEGLMGLTSGMPQVFKSRWRSLSMGGKRGAGVEGGERKEEWRASE